jgi:hypothetical protein
MFYLEVPMLLKIMRTPLRSPSFSAKPSLGVLVFLAPCLAAAASSVHATTVGVSALKDATILGTSSGADTGNASGRGSGLFTGTDGQNGVKRSLIQFDLAAAGIPNDAIIDSVTMTLSLGQLPPSGSLSQTLRLFNLNQTWSEGSSGSPTGSTISGSGAGYPRGNGDATWDYSNYNSDPAIAIKWQQDGTELHGGSFSSPERASSTFTTFASGSTFTWSSANMAADVKGWLNNPSDNNGWLLKSDEEDVSRSALGFWSKDGAAATGNLALAPTLEVNYSPIPEPETWGMMMAGLALLRGRVGRFKKVDNVSYAT